MVKRITFHKNTQEILLKITTFFLILHKILCFFTSYPIQGGDRMIDNSELPIGFTMELAQHSDILNKFARLSKEEQESIIHGARQTESRDEMRNYVENMFR